MCNVDVLCVTKATYEHDYVLRLHFNDGAVRLFDFATVYDKGIFTKLKELEYFKNFTIDPFTVDWNDEIGFAPEYLYEKGVPA